VEEKLKVTLESPPAPPSPVPEASETTEFAAASPTAGGSGGGGTSARSLGSGGKGSVEELQAENRSLREKLAMLNLRSDESAAAGKVSGGKRRGGGAGESIMLVHLVLVAIIAYILGVYLHR
jgi:hypothetical protein